MEAFVEAVEGRVLFAVAALPQLSGTYAGTTSSSFGTSDSFDVVVLSQKKAKVKLEVEIQSFSIQSFVLPDTNVPISATVSKKGALKGSKTVSIPVPGSKKPLKLTVVLNALVPADGSMIGGGGTLQGKVQGNNLKLPLTFSLTRIMPLPG